MPPILGNLIVIAALILVVALAARSLWKSHQSGGHCGGDCSRCGGCGGGCHTHRPDRNE
jgi:hypothetical protein